MNIPSTSDHAQTNLDDTACSALKASALTNTITNIHQHHVDVPAHDQRKPPPSANKLELPAAGYARTLDHPYLHLNLHTPSDHLRSLHHLAARPKTAPTARSTLA